MSGEELGGGNGTPGWWSHPDGPTGHGPGFGLPAGRPAGPLPEPGPLPAAGPWGRQGRPGGRVRPTLRVLLGGLLVIAGAGVLGGGVGALVQGERQGGRITLRPVPGASVHRDSGSTADVVQSALPGVVYLRVTDGSDTVTGTGIVLDGKGDILTNNHVVAPLGRPGRITVAFNSGQQHAASLVGRDVSSDLAVIDVKGVAGLHPIALGSAAGLRVGDPVLAIGAPFGLRSTVTAGIVSSLDRPVTGGSGAGPGLSYLDALQTDAAINPGNSGGPLLDSSGAVVGVNTAIHTVEAGSGDPYGTGAEAGSVGIGFAIPIDQAMRVATELIDGLRVTHSALGVTLNLGYQGGGQVLRSTAPGAVLLRPGDVVTAVGGTPVSSADDLIALVRGRAPGTVAVLTVQRGALTLTVSVPLRAVVGTAPSGAA
ncbi:PDZ domain-containing protein [Streptacidiphilus sp. 4-A2]|nr:PDZ domain-containing protein [Streptacidiphilus sp. 4-A2]